MENLLLAANTIASVNDLWYAFPLIVVVSLVYAATRHEQAKPILFHALRVGLWITGFMAVVFVVLLLIPRLF